MEISQKSLFTVQDSVHIFDDATEERIYELLRSESLDASSVADRLSLDIAIVAFKLSMMEVNGIVEMGI